MAVPTVITDLSATIASNSPAGGDAIGTSLDDFLRAHAGFVRQLFDTGTIFCGTVGGTADVITLTPTPAITAYKTGQAYAWFASGANTTNVTANISTQGAKAVTKNGTTALVSGDIPSGALVVARYDGTRLQLESATIAVSSAPFSDASAIIKNSSDATKKVIISASSVTTATTRTLTAQDKNYTIADNADLAAKAPLASPTFTGTPAAPTATANTSTTQLATTAFVNPANSIGANGYVKLASGVVIQWGSFGSFSQSNTTTSVTFPVAFGAACYSVVSTGKGPAGYVTTSDIVSAVSTTGFTVYSGCSGSFWIAVGI